MDLQIQIGGAPLHSLGTLTLVHSRINRCLNDLNLPRNFTTEASNLTSSEEVVVEDQAEEVEGQETEVEAGVTDLQDRPIEAMTTLAGMRED